MIPSTVVAIRALAFSGCDGLTSIFIPKGVMSIGSPIFDNCSNLKSIVVDKGNKFYDSRDECNAIIATSDNQLIAGCQNTVIPNNVTKISPAAFQGCTNLTSIQLPNGLTSISEYTFAYCTNLNSITLPESLVTISWNAFYNCINLTTVSIPKNVTSIQKSAFQYCRGLTSVISEIENPFPFGNYAFDHISNDCVLYVPAGTRDAYIAAGWTEDVFKGGIVEMNPTSVNLLEVEAMEDDAIYDLMGRRIAQKPAHGFYIQNGRKYLVR